MNTLTPLCTSGWMPPALRNLANSGIAASPGESEPGDEIRLEQRSEETGLMTNTKQPNASFLGNTKQLAEKSGLVGIKACSPTETVRRIADYCLSLPCMTEGLETAYSPNHTKGMTTRAHIAHQFTMINHYVGSEMKALEAFGEADYSALQAMVDNPNVPEKLNVSSDDLKELMEPLREGLSRSDWKVLSIVAAFHDLGKVDPKWAEDNGMDLTGVDWIAHDYDSQTMMEHNPGLLEPFQLTPEEREKVLTLSRLHSLPGQFFFGEGNVSAYSPLVKMADRESSENVLKLARIHGILDVMSALNHKFFKPILDSHTKLRTLISEAYEQKTPLGMKFRQVAVEELKEAGGEFLSVANDFGVGPVAMQRLRKLTSTKVEAQEFRNAFQKLDPTMIYEFQVATDGEETWFGTYVANAFGGGMLRALKETEVPASEAIAATVKMVACAARHQRQLEKTHGTREEWALGSLQPSLAVASGKEGALGVLAETHKIQTVEEGVQMLTTQPLGLTMRGGHTGIEIGYVTEENASQS